MRNTADFSPRSRMWSLCTDRSIRGTRWACWRIGTNARRRSISTGRPTARICIPATRTIRKSCCRLGIESRSWSIRGLVRPKQATKLENILFTGYYSCFHFITRRIRIKKRLWCFQELKNISEKLYTCMHNESSNYAQFINKLCR